ncbi:antibiotic biosynthesis monooxygenase [Mycoplasmatota bacterium zrk1]
MANQIAFTVQFDVKPEYLNEFMESLEYVLESMTVEDTFVSCYLHKNPNDQTKITVYEVWNEPSMEAFFENQIKVKDYRNDYEENLPKMLKSDRVITVLEPLKEWHK